MNTGGGSLRQKLSAYGMAAEQIDDESFHLPTAPFAFVRHTDAKTIVLTTLHA